MTRALRRSAGAACLILAISACGHDGPAPARTVTALDLSALPAGEDLTLDMRRADAAVVLDRTKGEIAFDRIELICPNGRSMPMSRWMRSQAAVRALDLAHRSEFQLVTTPPNPPSGSPPNDGTCPLHTYYKCERCPDGLVVCIDLCAPIQRSDGQPIVDTRGHFADLPDPLPTSPGDPPQIMPSGGGGPDPGPTNASSGSGGSAASGGSGGSGGGGGDNSGGGGGGGEGGGSGETW